MVCYIRTHTCACFLAACYCKFEFMYMSLPQNLFISPSKTSVLAPRVPISCKEDEKRKLKLNQILLRHARDKHVGHVLSTNGQWHPLR